MLQSAIRKDRWLAKLYFHRWNLAFIFLSTLLVAFGVREGFEHAVVNHFRDQSVQLPILMSYADPALFPGDILLDARESYVTWFYPALGVLSRYMPLQIIMLALYVISIGMTLTGIYFLADTLFPPKGVGLIAVLLWTAWLPNPGGDFLHSQFPTHTTTAVGMQLIGLVFALRKRYVIGALFIGLAANINAMTSVSFTIVWGFGLLYDIYTGREKLGPHLLRIPLVMALAAAPTIWWKFGAAPDSGNIPMQTFVDIMRTRLWYAIFPLSVNTLLWVAFAGIVGLWLYAARFVDKTTNRKVFWMMQGIVLLFAIGGFFSEVYPVELVIQLQLLRSTWVLNLFAMLYFAHMIRLWLDGGRPQIAMALLLTLGLALPRIIMEYYPIPHPVPYELYVDFNTSRANSSRITPAGALALGVLLLALMTVMHKMMRQYEVKNAYRVVGWFGFAATIFLVPLAINTEIPESQINTATEWRNTLDWVREHTDRTDLFVTPPTLDGFRVHAERGHYSDWKDGTLLVFNPDLAVIWQHRMAMLGFQEDEFAFVAPTQAQLCAITSEYTADYLVALNTWNIEGQTVYENSVFSVIPYETIPCEVGG